MKSGLLPPALCLFAAFGLLASPPTARADAPYENLFLVGDAAPNGWNIANPTEMQQDAEDPWIFTHDGFLISGEFKISTFKGDWCDDADWIRPPSMHPSIDDTDYIITTGCPPDEEDFKWLISDAGTYTITVDLREETITIDLHVAARTPYENLYLVGNATPAGWNIGNPTQMQQNPDFPWIFTFEGFLLPGEFKVPTFTGDWCDEEDWIRPPSMHPPVADTEYIITTGCPPDESDFKWVITTDEAGPARITINLHRATIVIDVKKDDSGEPPYDVLYLVGDATPGGWSLDAQTPMTVDDNNGFVFSWTGPLTEGEFKIKTYSDNNFCGGDWIHPLVSAQAFSETGYEVLEGCGPHDDNKWVVGEDQVGTYMITIDLEDEAISIVNTAVSTESFGELPTVFGLRQNYPNPFNPSTTIRYDVPHAAHVTLHVYDVAGRLVATLVNEAREPGYHSAFLDGAGLASGIYIYRLQAGDFAQTKKLMLIK